MVAEPALFLRDVARRLGRIQGSKKIADTKLLSLLQEGELKAGFRFPGSLAPWIPIPTGYWVSIGPDKFRTIHYVRDDDERTGAFKVPIRHFANEVVQVASQAIADSRQVQGEKIQAELVLEEWRLALISTTNNYEVMITEQEWQSYLSRHDLVEPSVSHVESETRGRHEKTSWRKLSVIIGAYVIADERTSGEEFKPEFAAEKIHAIATNDGIRDLPALTTIEDVLNAIKARARTILKK